MQTIIDPSNILLKDDTPFNVALGNFDGVHRGHKKLIRSMVQSSENEGFRSSVFTLVPHPQQVLHPQHAPPMITDHQKKRELIRRQGVEYFFVQPFTRSFARLDPTSFFKRFLLQSLHVNTLFVGYNYRFGQDGEGDAQLLRGLGITFDFRVRIMEPVSIDDTVVSSTFIRRMIGQGRMQTAARFLGHPFSVRGRVVSGQKLARAMGFPTANIRWSKHIVRPACGVYVVRILVGDVWHEGIANFGRRPTFYPHGDNGGQEGMHLEVHIFDFRELLYGRRLEVFFLKKLRNELCFEGPSSLRSQILKDIDDARRLLASPGFICDSSLFPMGK